MDNYCRNCGKKMPKNAKICKSCGTEVINKRLKEIDMVDPSNKIFYYSLVIFSVIIFILTIFNNPTSMFYGYIFTLFCFTFVKFKLPNAIFFSIFYWIWLVFSTILLLYILSFVAACDSIINGLV